MQLDLSSGTIKVLEARVKTLHMVLLFFSCNVGCGLQSIRDDVYAVQLVRLWSVRERIQTSQTGVPDTKDTCMYATNT